MCLYHCPVNIGILAGEMRRQSSPCCFLQYVSLPSLHCVQSKHAEICAPTPTRSPTLTVVTLGPTLTAVPTISATLLY
jgi:hypothetical protein